MNAPIRIDSKPGVLIIGPYPPPYGGVATVIKSLSQQDVLADKFSLSLYKIGRKHASTSFMAQFCIDLNHVLRFPLDKRARSSKIIHIHTASYWSFVRSIPYVVISKSILNSKVILHIHGAEFHLFYKNSNIFMKAIIKKILRMNDAIIVTSPAWIEVINNILGDTRIPVYPLPNGYEAKVFFPLPIAECREKLNLPKNIRILVTIGHLEDYKGHKYLIDAIKLLVPEKKDIAAYVIGKGSLKDNLTKQIQENKLEDHVILAGGDKSDDEIPLWMNACDIFVLPSLNEGNPTVMFEALGCSKPFVGTRVGGVPEIIVSESYGLLVEPANSKDLADKIKAALEKDWNKQEISQYASQFTWENISKRMITIYESVINHAD
jgi:glycosyltransferase involved in cell wall biosynthesis